MSKLIERIVSEQVRAFLIDSDLMPPLQSAYRLSLDGNYVGQSYF